MRIASLGAYALAAVATIATACGGGDEDERTSRAFAGESQVRTASANNQPPRIDRLEITPVPLQPGKTARAVVEASDPDGDGLQTTYQWYVDGEWHEAARRASFETAELSRGMTVELRVTVSDGGDTPVEKRTHVELANRSPEIRWVGLDGEDTIRPNQEVTARPEASDADGDTIQYSYRWLVNDRERGKKESFSTRGLKHGDELVVEVTARDDFDTSKPHRSNVIQLANSAPVLIGKVPKPSEEGGRFVYQFEASDPDGDKRLRWSLSESPAGMDIDPLLGTMTWAPRTDQVGRHPVEVKVSDSQGKSSSMRFHLNVNEDFEPESGSAPAKPAPR